MKEKDVRRIIGMTAEERIANLKDAITREFWAASEECSDSAKEFKKKIYMNKYRRFVEELRGSGATHVYLAKHMDLENALGWTTHWNLSMSRFVGQRLKIDQTHLFHCLEDGSKDNSIRLRAESGETYYYPYYLLEIAALEPAPILSQDMTIPGDVDFVILQKEGYDTVTIHYSQFGGINIHVKNLPEILSNVTSIN